VKVTATQGDWVKVENVWDAAKGGDAWLMFQNSKGKQMAEPGGDAAAFAALKAQLKAAKDAAENGEAPPDTGGGGGGGFGGSGGGGFGAKKEVSAEEAELLKLLKGFGSTTHEGGDDGGNAAAPPAAPPKAAEAAKKPPAPKPPAPKPKPAAPVPPPAAATSSTGGGSSGADGQSLPVQKAVGGGTFWVCLSAIRARDETSASGEVVGEMNKGDFCHVLSQDGDWCKVRGLDLNGPESSLSATNIRESEAAPFFQTCVLRAVESKFKGGILRLIICFSFSLLLLFLLLLHT
jgi:hypothetical protein